MRRDDAGLARTGTFEPAAPERRRDAEQHEEQRVHPAQVAIVPVAGGGEKRVEQRSSAQATDCVMPIGRDSGSQNTLKP